MLSEKAAASESTSTTVSEKKLRCVKTGSLTKSWTHSNTPRTVFSGMATRSKHTVNFSPEGSGPRRARAVNWNTWNDTLINQKCSQVKSQLCGNWYIPCTDGSAHGNQPAKNRRSRRSLHQGGSSWTSAPVTSVLARKTGTPICKPPYRHLSPIPLREDHPKAGQTAAMGHDHPHQPALEDKNSLAPALLTTLPQQSKARNSQSPPGTSYNRVGTPSWGRHYPPSPKPTKPEYQPKTGLLLWRRTSSD